MPKRRKSDGNIELPIGDVREVSTMQQHVTGKPDAAVSNDVAGRQPSTDADRQEIFLPISGFVWLYPEEIEVIDHPAFQRLGRIYQLGQTYLVYRGATHKRLEHALGALHMVQRMINAVAHTSRKALRRGDYAGQQSFRPGAPLTSLEQRFIRLGALLHDIGHIAAGHTVEDELSLVGRHDGNARLKILFSGSEWVDDKGRTLEQCLDMEFPIYIPEGLQKSGVTASQIVWLLIRKKPGTRDGQKGEGKKEGGEDPLKEVSKLVEGSHEIRLNVCRDMIGNTICADILDYIHRDWYHVGKPRPFDERILQYMEVRTEAGNFNGGQPLPNRTDRFVISLGRRPKIRTDAVSAILELLEWRYQLAESVLFHRTKLAAAAMLDRALFELWGDNPSEVEGFLLPLSDEEMLSKCIEKASRTNNPKDAVAHKILSALEKRQLFSTLFTWSFADLLADHRRRVQTLYGKSEEDKENVAPQNRARALKVLESDFKLPEGSLAIYCPTAGMNAKIAEVQIAVNDEVEPFDGYERRNENELSGGHLAAQLHRFDRLWRLHVFIHPSAEKSISPVKHLLRHAIEKLVLGCLDYGENSFEVASSMAISLTNTPNSPWYGGKVVDQAVIAAHWDPSSASGDYLFGPSIRSFIETKLSKD